MLAHRSDERSAQLEKLGAEVVFGDFLDFDSVRAALNGVQRAHFCYPINQGLAQATAQFGQAAKEAGVEITLNMSRSPRAAMRRARRTSALVKRARIRLVGRAGSPSQADVLPENLLNLAPMIREGHMPVPFSNMGRHAPVAAEDQARLIVRILQNPGPHMGKTYPLFGPVELTQSEIAAIVAKVLGKEVKYENVPFEKFAELRSGRSNQSPQNTLASFYSDPGAFSPDSGNSFVIQHVKEVAIDHHNGIFADTNNYIAEIGGRQPMTVEEFVTRNREALSDPVLFRATKRWI